MTTYIQVINRYSCVHFTIFSPNYENNILYNHGKKELNKIAKEVTKELGQIEPQSK
jgi:REP element-mobilizing transposase RayT